MDTNTLVITPNLQSAINAFNRQNLQLDIQEYLIDSECTCDECQDILSINDKAAIITTLTATPAIFTGVVGPVATVSMTAIGLGSFGLSAAVGAGIYFGYKWLMKNYRDEEDMKKAQWAIAKDNHRRILGNVREQLQKIRVAKEQLENSGQIMIDEVPINYRENECPICLELLIVEDTSFRDETEESSQKILQRLPCGHILHEECYMSLLQSSENDNVCPICRASLTVEVPEFVVYPLAAPIYNPKTIGQFIKSKFNAIIKETKDLLTIAGKVIADVVGTALVVIGGGFLVIWVPTVVPVLVFVGATTGNLSFCINGIVCSLGLASTAVVGGMMLCSFNTK
jgi:hypothetical protein